MVDRNILAPQLFTGVSRQHLAYLVEELPDPWQAMVEGRRHEARGGARKREAGAGARHRLVFAERLFVTLIHLRHDLPQSVLAMLAGVDHFTVTRAIGEMRGLLAERGNAVPDHPGLRLDATEIQVRQLTAGHGGRRACVSGEKKQNTMKATALADHQGRTLWTDVMRPGRMHDVTATRNETIGTCSQHFPNVEVLVDSDYLGLRRGHTGQAITPPENRTRSLCRTYTQPEKRRGTDTHRSASQLSTPSPTTNAGNS
ncbi:transposase family protein [Streptomyces albidoflavus]